MLGAPDAAVLQCYELDLACLPLVEGCGSVPIQWAFVGTPTETSAGSPPDLVNPHQSGTVYAARRKADHRLLYFEYDGPIAPAHAGGPARGHLREVCRGFVTDWPASPPSEGEILRLRLVGPADH